MAHLNGISKDLKTIKDGEVPVASATGNVEAVLQSLSAFFLIHLPEAWVYLFLTCGLRNCRKAVELQPLMTVLQVMLWLATSHPCVWLPGKNMLAHFLPRER